MDSAALESDNLEFINVFSLQVSTSFQKKVQSKIKDLLQQMEEGLKTADPHDFSTYTGWTGVSLTTLKMWRDHSSVIHPPKNILYFIRLGP